MSTLLLRFAAPLQSWGSSSRFNIRMTEREPTKSGVIGMIAGAMGRRRTESVDDLQNLVFGVRIDQAGKLMYDFHTAKAEGEKNPFISNRYYIMDAVFLVGLEGNDEILADIDFAIKNPFFPLYLGRRSCPPTGPVSLGVKQNVKLTDAMRDLEIAPWQASEWYMEKQGKKVRLELVVDADSEAKSAFLKNDLPVSFNQKYRNYAQRYVVHSIDSIDGVIIENLKSKGTHDPMEVL